MKKSLKAILVLGATLLLMFVGFTVGAEGETEYILADSEGEYILSAYGESSIVPVMRSASVSEIFEYLNNESENTKTIVLNDVAVEESIDLDGNYILTGQITFSNGSLLNVHSGETRLEGFNALLLEKSYIRIKGGALKVADSEIIANTCSAVVMDYSAEARFFMQSGEIRTSSNEAALKLTYGSAHICGGKISNSVAFAADIASSFTVSGTPELEGVGYDILTNTPIRLSNGGVYFSGAFSVKYTNSFSEGSIVPVFYSASEASLQNIELYDLEEKKQSLHFFDEYDSIDEKKFGAVYLPYTIDFYHNGILIETQKLLSEMTLRKCEAPEMSGYDFVGWTTDRGGENLYDFAQNVNSSFSLYSKYSLQAPSFVLNGYEGFYTGKEIEVGFQAVEHPLIDSSIIEYTWYRNGEAISASTPKIKLLNVLDSGMYKCQLKFTFGTDSITVVTPEVLFDVKKAQIEIPEIKNKFYTGTVLSPDIYSTYLYTVSECTGIEVGTYPVKLSVCDSQNYEFENQKDVIYLDFTINRTENFWTQEPAINDVYEGNTAIPMASSRFGEVKYLYSSEPNGAYTSEFPKEHGIYYCLAYVEENENYYELKSNPVVFYVLEEKVSGISVNTMPHLTVYTAFDYFIADGFSLTVAYNSQRKTVVFADEISFAYQSAENLRYGDSAVVASYAGFSVSVPVTVLAAEYDLSGISFQNKETVFNGNRQSIEFSGALPIGKDGISLEAYVVGGGVNAGTYSVKLMFETASHNYEIPAPIEVALNIIPYEALVIFTDTEFIYDGALKCPDAYYTDINGKKCVLSVEGAHSYAGEYTAAVTTNDSNYKLLSPSIRYVILKADYDFSGIFWSEDSFVYDSSNKTVTLSGLPSGVSVIGYVNNTGADAGEYLAKALLSYDSENYNAPPEISHEWKINKAEYNLNGFSFWENTVVFDGEKHYPILSGEMPVGLDGIALEYSFSKGSSEVKDGRVEVVIAFSTKSKNYIVPDSITSYVQVTPLGITVVWGGADFTYNMLTHVPSASAAECEVRVVGGKINAGTYTATAIAVNANYYVINSTMEFTVRKADNLWTSPLIISDIFEGREPSPSAKCLAGDIEYRYADGDGNLLSEIPSEAGGYYVFAIALGNENYNSKISDGVFFEIKKVLPIGLSVTLIKNQFSAFQKITNNDVKIMLENNDGSIVMLSVNDVNIRYSTSDSLRYSDTSVAFSYLGFEKAINISVAKANYDMSAVVWENSVQTYDGTEKSIILSGLPEGISVIEYVGGKGINSGKYEGTAILAYDDFNYNPPILPQGQLVIKKQVVTCPEVLPLIYSGTTQYPDIEASHLYDFSADGGKDAGTYSVVFRILDGNNYEFINSNSSITVNYEILPRAISIELGDADKYLFSSVTKPEYSVVGGTVIEGDDLKIKFIYGEDFVDCISENQNYLLTVTKGRIHRHNSLSEDSIFLLFLIFLIIITVLLILYVAIRKKEAVAHYFAILKCRLSPAAKAAESVEEKTVNVEEEIFEIKAANEVLDASMSVDRERADSLITDALAKNLVRKDYEKIYTSGSKKEIINIDTISESFSPGERVDVNRLKEMSLVPYDTAYIKVLARGMIDKPLRIYANDFSLSAVKMIALTGGEAIRCVTVKNYGFEKKENNP